MKEHEIKEKIENGSILCRIIIEIAGSPKEHVEKTIDLVIESLKQVKDVEIIKSEKFPAEEQEIPGQKVTKAKIFSTFAEIELLVKDMQTLIALCFEYMPSSIEMIEPENMKITSQTAATFLNDLLARLHQTDMILKNKNAENTILKQNASALLQNIFKLSLKEKDKTIEEISKDVGIPTHQIQPFLDALIKQEKLEKKKDKYSYITK